MRYQDYVHRLVFLSLALFSAVGPARAQPPRTLGIDSLDLDRSSMRVLDGVRVMVRNVTSEPQSGVLWYVLSSPGEPEPWRVYDYASPEQAVQLRAGGVRVFEIPGPGQGLDGSYELSVWLHGLQPGGAERFHSDARTFKDTIVVAPPFSFAVSQFAGSELGKKPPLLIRFSVRNNGSESVNIGLQYRISRVDEKPRAAGSAFARIARVSAGVDYVVTVQHRQAIPEGRWKLTGWLYEFSPNPRVRATREEIFDIRN